MLLMPAMVEMALHTGPAEEAAAHQLLAERQYLAQEEMAHRALFA